MTTPSDNQDINPDVQSQETGETTHSNSRRRLLIGAAGTPILGMLASRPVLGATRCSPSGFASDNLSNTVENVSCGGLSPGYWMNHFEWPGGYLPGIHSDNAKWGTGKMLDEDTDCEDFDVGYDQSGEIITQCMIPSVNGIPLLGNPVTRFADVFGPPAAVPQNDLNITPSNITMMEVLRMMNGSLEFHAVASVLNAAANFPEFIMTEAEVVDMYQQARDLGYYMTTSGKRIDDVQAFFESMYH